MIILIELVVLGFILAVWGNWAWQFRDEGSVCWTMDTSTNKKTFKGLIYLWVDSKGNVRLSAQMPTGDGG